MGKPPIKQSDVRGVATVGEFKIIPGANDLSFHVGMTTAFMDMKEVYQLVRTLDYQATQVWGDKWVAQFTPE